MSEPHADILIEQLRRANRRWKILALSALATLVLAVAGVATFTVMQVGREKAAAEAAREEAEQARQEMKEAMEYAAMARSQLDQLIYASRILPAQQAWEEGVRERKKP